ncbi:unnamed protein product [Allacma fusca]|uniref:Uncharacterized protein n=1 Tax=Allacma fusca TaxID=39272 RepID=A0A8J2LTV3_9HEXA|nr:unnamed protein product [Allacma fusca]
MDDNEDDWVFVDDERTKSVLVIDNEANNSRQDENDENQEREEPIEEDFSWENSLIEHPSVYIASHQQQHLQQLQREEKSTEELEVADPRSGVSTRESNRNTRASRNAPNLPQQQQHPRTNPHPRHLINHNSQTSSLDIVDVLKQQQQSKKKHCQRNAKVQQNVRNKPQRRSDKQTYTRFSRVNNDRKCC